MKNLINNIKYFIISLEYLIDKISIVNIMLNSLFLGLLILFLDLYDIPTYLYNEYCGLTIFTLLFLIIFLLKEIYNKELFYFINSNVITFFDKVLFIIFFSIIFLLEFYTERTCYLFILSSSLVVVIFLLLIRIILVIKPKFNSLKNMRKTYNIASLYHNKIKNEDFVLLDDNPCSNSVDDLLGINLFVDVLKDTLTQYKPKNSYTIGLIGKWGSGKTTIINILKNKFKRDNNKSNILIDVFQPWKYDNKVSLFKGFYGFLFKMIGKKSYDINYTKSLRKYEKAIFNIVKHNIGLSLDDFIDFNVEDDIEDIKEKINDFISLIDRQIVVVIDDIDRLDKEQILLIFKTIKTLFNFDNIIYILCYDEERIQKVFDEELNIDSKYLDKIINSCIYVPKLESDKITEIGICCIKNLLNIYKIKDYDYDYDKMTKILRIIFMNFVDLREIIKFINTISFTIKCCDKLNLDICDFIVLEYIKFKDLNLYNMIYNNPNYFISLHEPQQDIIFPITAKEFTKKHQSFFDETFKDKDLIKELLSYVFPYVKIYNQKMSLIKGNLHNDNVGDKRCYDGRYFDCYFSIKSTTFGSMEKHINTFIANVNQNNNFKNEFYKIINKIDVNNHSIFFELLSEMVSSINNTNSYFNFVLNQIMDKKDNKKFNVLYLNWLIVSIIKSEKNMNIKKQYIDKIFDIDLLVFDSIVHYLSRDLYGGKDNEIYLYSSDKLKNKLNNMIDKNINIFDNSNYKIREFNIFYRNFDDQNKIRNYLINLINKENIFKILSDGIFIRNNKCFLEKKYLETTLDIKKINDILNTVDYKLNNDQLIVKKLYDDESFNCNENDINFNNL